MGGYLSKFTSSEQIESTLLPNPRPLLHFSTLQFLDLLLIRSRSDLVDFSLDSRISTTIRYGALGVALPEEQSWAQWDRIGLIQLPTFLERHEYNEDNIEVTEATYTGIQTRTLRQVLEGSMEVAVRSLKLVKSKEENESNAAETRSENWKREKRLSASGTNAATLAAAATVAPTSSTTDNEDISSSSSGTTDDTELRLEYLQKYYQFTGPIINRPYGQCMDKLEGLFKYVTTKLRMYELSTVDIETVEKLVKECVEQYEGADGKMLEGIPFKELLPLFRKISEARSGSGSGTGGFVNAGIGSKNATSENNNTSTPPKPDFSLNTFSDSEIYELVNLFTSPGADDADDKVSLSNTGYLSSTEFMQHWKSSFERTVPLRKNPREVLSGAFVSQALQQIGVLPQGAYFMPGEFGMMSVGDDDADSEGEKGRKEWEIEAEEERRRLHQQRMARKDSAGVTSLERKDDPAAMQAEAELKKSTSSGPADSQRILARHGSNLGHHSILMSRSTWKFPPNEGPAVQRVFQHGVARLGRERSVQMEMQQDVME